jgi:hypothetical protein
VDVLELNIPVHFKGFNVFPGVLFAIIISDIMLLNDGCFPLRYGVSSKAGDVGFVTLRGALRLIFFCVLQIYPSVVTLPTLLNHLLPTWVYDRPS